MSQRRLGATIGVVLLSVLLLVAAVFGYGSVIRDQPVLLAFQVPQNYSGWLVVSWNCAGGQRLADSLVAGRRYEPLFADDGSLCFTDDVPATGYAVIDYRYQYRLDDEEPNDGLTPVASPFLRTGPAEIQPGVGSPTTIDPPIGAAGNHHYDVAWVEVIQHSDDEDSPAFPEEGLALGDRCDLDRFLQQRFQEPATATTCGPISTRQEAGLSK